MKVLILTLVLANAPPAAARTCVDLFSPRVAKRAAITEVTETELGTRKLRELSEALENRVASKEIAGLSAVDLGLTQKILVVDFKNLGSTNFRPTREIRTLINPTIVKQTSQSAFDWRACLALRCEPFLLTRSIAVEFFNVEGGLETVRVSGESARVLEREVARLDGRELSNERITVAEFLKHIVRKKINSAVDPIQSTLAARKNGAKAFAKLRHDWIDPYSLTYDVRREVERAGGNSIRKIGELHEILNEVDSANIKDRLNRWTQSEAQALLAVEAMMQAGWHRYQKAYEALTIDNLFFSDTIKVRGPPNDSAGLLTFAYEKEGQATSITEWYRDPKLTDAQWLALPPEQRKERLQTLKIPERDFVSAEMVAPMVGKPAHLSGFSFEEGKTKKFLWEVSHKRFEVSLHRALSQVNALATALKDASSIHFHVSFDLAAHYRTPQSPSFGKLMNWFKHTNDYLYLRGMEEGLHGTSMVAVTHRPEDFGPRESKWRKVIPANPKKIWGHETKFFSMGIRSGMYGNALTEGAVRVGFELRDTTRKLDRLEEYSKRLAEATAESRWLRAPEDATSEIPQLATTWKRSAPLLYEHFEIFEAAMLYKMNKSVAIGLMKFETGTYYDFKTGQAVKVDPTIAQIMVEARAKYVQDLRNLLVEVKELNDRGESFEMQDAGTAVSMSLTDWARAATPAELYRHY